jgi:RNA polymerase sigma factor (sigma-70 family)
MKVDPTSPGRVLFETHLPTIQELVRKTCRRQRLDPEQTEDFTSHALLRLLEDDCAILRKFRGKSSLRTFLTVVIQRLLLDYRIRQWRKWRPGAQARRLGGLAIELDRLINRDGHSRDEAVDLLMSTRGLTEPRGELLRLAGELPRRAHPRLESLDDLPPLPVDGGVEQRLLERERAATAGRTQAALERALSTLPAEDRLILKMRYEDDFTVREIAAALHLPARPLYRRCERCLERLAERLRTEGVTRAEAGESIGWEGWERRRVEGGGARGRASPPLGLSAALAAL